MNSSKIYFSKNICNPKYKKKVVPAGAQIKKTHVAKREHLLPGVEGFQKFVREKKNKKEGVSVIRAENIHTRETKRSTRLKSTR